MTNRIWILLVEDETSNIDAWNDAVAAFNADVDTNGFEISSDYVSSVADAKSFFSYRTYDAVIVDLRLKSQEGFASPNEDGGKLIDHLISSSAVGIAIYTGQEGEFDSSGYPPQVNTFSKADGLGPVLEWIKQERLLFNALRTSRARIEREVARVFFSAIWPRWKMLANASQGNATKFSESMTRHVVAHVHDVLLNSVEVAHFEESYFAPPVKENLDTGDILEIGGTSWIVVTPRCDLANADKTVSILLAKCKDVSAKWKELLEAQSKGALKSIEGLIQHDKSLKQHFLPPMFVDASTQKGPWLVQFDDLQVSPILEKDTLTQLRYASLTPQFVPSLVERFGAYFSRIGTPSISG